MLLLTHTIVDFWIAKLDSNGRHDVVGEEGNSDTSTGCESMSESLQENGDMENNKSNIR